MDSVLYPWDLTKRILDPPTKGTTKAWSVEQEKWRRAKLGRMLGYARRAFRMTRKGVRRAEHEHRPLIHFIPDDGEAMVVHEDEVLFMDSSAIQERRKHAMEERLKKARRKRKQT